MGKWEIKEYLPDEFKNEIIKYEKYPVIEALYENNYKPEEKDDYDINNSDYNDSTSDIFIDSTGFDSSCDLIYDCTCVNPVLHSVEIRDSRRKNICGYIQSCGCGEFLSESDILKKYYEEEELNE